MKRFIAIAAVALMLCLGLAAGCSSGAQGSATSIPDEVYAGAATVDLEDGEYTVDVKFAGGSGKASIDSPATVVVRNGKAAAQIVWSSPYYDYMIVDGTKYSQVNKDGENSVFQIPVTAFDSPMKVIGDTTAMSTPHEIDYEITFVGSSAAKK